MARTPVDYSIPEYYDFYKETTVKGLTNPYNVFKGVIESFNKKVGENMLAGNSVWIYYLGLFKVLKYKDTAAFENKAIDWKATNALWDKYPALRKKKYIKHLNEHSDGFKYRLKWIKSTCRIVNMTSFKFKAVRDLNRKLAHKIKNKEQEYA